MDEVTNTEVTPETPDTTAPDAPETTPESGADKPFLGEQPAATEADKPADSAAPETAENKEGEQAKPADESAYMESLVKDEDALGTDANVQLDKDLLKACVPAMQKYGVTPEAANALANALAKAQVDQAREAMQNRIEYFNRMKAESLRTYTPKDFEQINAGIDRWFKPNGVMNNVIRNSELGADPEFLALMHHLGGALKQDGLSGAMAGGGGSSADPNSTEGLSKLW